MKLHAALFSLSFAIQVTAAAKNAAPAVQAQPAVIAQPAAPGAVAKSSTLINSEMGGRDVVFLSRAMDLGRGLTFLAQQTAKTTNPLLQSYGADLLKSLDAQNAMLITAAEMRNVNPPERYPTLQKYTDKLASLEGAKFEKAILDAFVELNQHIVTTYEANAKSPDITISKFITDALPKSRVHLATVQRFSGISPSQQPHANNPKAAQAMQKAKPVFRTNIPTRIN